MTNQLAQQKKNNIQVKVQINLILDTNLKCKIKGLFQKFWDMCAFSGAHFLKKSICLLAPQTISNDLFFFFFTTTALDWVRQQHQTKVQVGPKRLNSLLITQLLRSKKTKGIYVHHFHQPPKHEILFCILTKELFPIVPETKMLSNTQKNQLFLQKKFINSYHLINKLY